jgi:hypothetical protein
MEEKNKDTAVDPLTGEIFIKKRNNQIFANPENQIMYNNLKAREKRNTKAKADRILDKNREVLKRTLGPKEEIIKSKDYLDGAGLNFGYNTHTIIRNGIKWICIYNYAYALFGANSFKIMKIKE